MTGANPQEATTAPEGKERVFHAADYGAALTAALVAMAVYWRTLAPTVTGEDSGEFITAAWSLGIPHPPGYPTWCMLAHLFTWLPRGCVAWRVNLMSSVFGAGTVFLIALLIILLTRSRPAGLCGGLALAFSREFWEQSVIAEVYTLNAFVVAACVLLLLRWHQTRRDRLLYGFALLYGLGLGVHNTFILLGPLFALFLFLSDLPTLRWKTYAALVGIGALGSLAYLYLPVRSPANPAMDWGNPESLQNFWDVIRRKQLSFQLTENPRELGRFLRQMAVMGGFWWREFTPWVGAFGAAGVLILLRRQLAYGLFLCALAFTTMAGFAFIQNFNFDKEWLWVMTVFNIPGYMVTAVSIGVALDAVGRLRGGQWLAMAAAAVCVVSPLAQHWHHNDKSEHYWARDYAMNVLNSLSPDAIYIPDADHQSFPAVYLQAVEGVRPDIFIGRKCGYLEPALLAGMPEPVRAAIGEFPRRRDEPRIIAWLLENTDRPLYMSVPPRLPPGTGAHIAQAGLVYRVLRPGETMDTRDYWAGYQWHTLGPGDARGDFTAELILYEIAVAKAKEHLRAGDTQNGLALLEEALGHYGRDPVVLNNIGVIAAKADLYEAAEGYFREALSLYPRQSAARRNLELLEDRK